MPKKRPIDDDDDDSSFDAKPKKRKRKEERKKPIGLFIVISLAALLLLVGGYIVFRVATKGDRNSNGTPTAGTGSGSDRTGAPSVKVGANLLTNGNFEDGPEPDAEGPGFTPMEAGSTAIPGWTVTRGSVDYIGPYWQHADGRRSIDLNGNEPGAIAQTIKTQPGKKYQVSFRMAANAMGDGGVRTLAVNAAGVKGEFTFDAAGRSYTDMGWSIRTWEFTASANETTIEFWSTTDTPVAGGPAIDSVSVAEVLS